MNKTVCPGIVKNQRLGQTLPAHNVLKTITCCYYLFLFYPKHKGRGVVAISHPQHLLPFSWANTFQLMVAVEMLYQKNTRICR